MKMMLFGLVIFNMILQTSILGYCLIRPNNKLRLAINDNKNKMLILPFYFASLIFYILIIPKCVVK